MHLDNCSALGFMTVHLDHGSAQGCMRVHCKSTASMLLPLFSAIAIAFSVGWQDYKKTRVHIDDWSELGSL